MQRFGSAKNGRRAGGGVVPVLMLCLLPAVALAQSSAQMPTPPRLSAADLPDLTLASSDGLRIGRAALPEAAPQLPPARTAARVAAAMLAPTARDGTALAPVTPAALPESTALSRVLPAPVSPAPAPRAEALRPRPVALAAPAPRPRIPAPIAAAVPPERLPPVASAPLAGRWLDPQDPADRALLEGIFGAALPPGLMLEPPAPTDPAVLALAVQTELQRLNCYRGALDGDWGRGSQSALAAYGKAQGTPPETLDPTSALLQELKALPEGKVCPDPPAPKPAAAATKPAQKQQTSKPAQKQQAKPPAPQQQPAKPAKKKPDIAIIGL